MRRASWSGPAREVAVVMGSPENLKITQPSDLELAEFYLRRRA